MVIIQHYAYLGNVLCFSSCTKVTVPVCRLYATKLTNDDTALVWYTAYLVYCLHSNTPDSIKTTEITFGNNWSNFFSSDGQLTNKKNDLIYAANDYIQFSTANSQNVLLLTELQLSL